MIIIPTEKRFDWQHAPLVLFAIVFLNLLVYFFYQFNDEQKIHVALERYTQEGFFEVEWPAWQKFLEGQEELELLQDMQNTYKAANLHGNLHANLHANLHDNSNTSSLQSLSLQILLRPDFFPEAENNGLTFKTNDERYHWLDTRAAINRQAGAVSFLKFGLIPGEFSVISLFTHQFLHGSLMHLMGNLLFLMLCGFAVEAAIGHKMFLAFYLVSGLAGSLLFTLVNWGSMQPLVGASGAISGVMAMYLAVFRLKKIEFFYWFFIFVGYFRAPALAILPVYIGKELYSLFFGEATNVAFMAHIGGFVMGGLLVILLLKIKPETLNNHYIEQDQAIDPRREALSKIYRCMERMELLSALKRVAKEIPEQPKNFDLICLHAQLALIAAQPDSGLSYGLSSSVDGASNKDSSDESILGASDPDHDAPSGSRLTEVEHTAVQALLALWRYRNPTQQEVVRLEQSWQQSPSYQVHLGEQDQVKLAMAFTSANYLQGAETLYESVAESSCRPSNLGVLARKLSMAFAEQGDKKRAKAYEQQAEILLAQSI